MTLLLNAIAQKTQMFIYDRKLILLKSICIHKYFIEKNCFVNYILCVMPM